MIRALAVALLAAAAAGPAQSHEFWVEPAQFWIAPGAPTPLALMVGVGDDRARWTVAPAKAAQLRVHSATGVAEALQRLRPPGGDADAVLTLPARGLSLIAFESRNSFSTLPAARFHSYLNDEGMEAIVALRTSRGQAAKPGRERYSRRAKALVQVGGVIGERDAATAMAPLGQTLEIVPERNPYALAAGQPLPVRVLYRGRPLPGALLKLFSLDLGQKPLAQQRTGADGRAAFTVPQQGDWLVSVVWTQPVTAPDADFETIFSSLSFGWSGRGGA